jgi:hypothetical protein
MFSQDPPIPVINEPVYLFIDPAAGGPQSDYAMLSVTRQKGMLTVCCPAPELTTARADNRLAGHPSMPNPDVARANHSPRG